MKSRLLPLILIVFSIVFNFSYKSDFAETLLAKQEAFGESPNTQQCRCVAFRLDDIQDYFVVNPQIQVINTFEKKNANLTVGIIGNAFGNDLSIVSFLKQKKLQYDNHESNFYIELANHGWNHEDFTHFNKLEQSNLIQRTNDKIFNIFGTRPIVFIPPYNNLNNNTAAALIENGIHYVSANATAYSASTIPKTQAGNGSGIAGMPSQFDESNMFFLPSLAVTGDLNADSTQWIGYTHSATFSAVNDSVNQLGYAVVTMHPMEYSIRNGTKYQNSVDNDQVRQLELLIDDIRAAGFKIVTISQIDNGNIGSIPEFYGYSTYAALTISITMSIWLTTKFYGPQMPGQRGH